MRKVTKLLSRRSPEEYVITQFEAQRDGALDDKGLALFEQSLAQSGKAQHWIKEQQELVYQLQLDALPTFSLSSAARLTVQQGLYKKLRRGTYRSGRRRLLVAMIVMALFAGIFMVIGSSIARPVIYYNYPDRPIIVEMQSAEAPLILSEGSPLGELRLQRFALAGGLRAIDAGQFMIDRENNIWLNSRNGRLLQFDQQLWHSFSFEDDLWRDGLGPITASNDDALWLGNSGFGVLRFDGESWQSAPFAGQFSGQHLMSATQGADGTLWLGTSGGLLRYDGFSWQLFNIQNGLPYGSISQLLANADGTIWFTSLQAPGLALFNGATTTLYSLPEQIQSYEVTALAAAPDGAIWLGTQNGLLRFDGNNWSERLVLDGAVDGWITSLAFSANGDLWTGTRAGLYQYDGENWASIDTSEPSNETIFDVEVDGTGTVWALTDSGLLRLDVAESEVAPIAEPEDIAP
ncbi:MAG: hypothetical protein KDE59_02155 [Anaerolineales bacterium]|nr:hypothetical protein [Anaerolineales bacterium]